MEDAKFQKGKYTGEVMGLNPMRTGYDPGKRGSRVEQDCNRLSIERHAFCVC